MLEQDNSAEPIRVNALLVNHLFRLDHTSDSYVKTTQALTQMLSVYTCKLLRCLDLAQVSDLRPKPGLEARNQKTTGDIHRRTAMVDIRRVLSWLGSAQE